MEVKFTKRIGSFILGSSRQWSERVGGGTWKSANLVSIRRSMERSMDVRNGVWNGIVNSQPVLALICFQVVIIPDLILLVRIFDKSGDIANLNEMVGDKFESGSPVAVPAVTNPTPFFVVFFPDFFLSFYIFLIRLTYHRVCCGKPPTLGSSCTRWTSWNHGIGHK